LGLEPVYNKVELSWVSKSQCTESEQNKNVFSSRLNSFSPDSVYSDFGAL